jgi:hypothetical protein
MEHVTSVEPMSASEDSHPDEEIQSKYFCIGADSIFETIPISDENYPSGENIQTWIELYFDTAQGASIDPFSLMELFRIETSNSVVTFLPRQVKANNFSVAQPHSEWENLERIEIAGNFINTTNFGLIVFQISAGLKDNIGNKNEKTQKISVIK